MPNQKAASVFDHGITARSNGLPRTANPLTTGTRAHADWDKGWMTGQARGQASSSREGDATYWRRAPPADLQASSELAVTSTEALRVFRGLIFEWQMPQARAWRMLTGVGWQAGSLSAEQIQRVEILFVVNQALQGVALGSVGVWLVTPNAAPLFAGTAPADYLIKLGQSGYVGLLRQVLHWQELQARRLRVWVDREEQDSFERSRELQLPPG